MAERIKYITVALFGLAPSVGFAACNSYTNSAYLDYYKNNVNSAYKVRNYFNNGSFCGATLGGATALTNFASISMEDYFVVHDRRHTPCCGSSGSNSWDDILKQSAPQNNSFGNAVGYILASNISFYKGDNSTDCSGSSYYSAYDHGGGLSNMFASFSGSKAYLLTGCKKGWAINPAWTLLGNSYMINYDGSDRGQMGNAGSYQLIYDFCVQDPDWYCNPGKYFNSTTETCTACPTYTFNGIPYQGTSSGGYNQSLSSCYLPAGSDPKGVFGWSGGNTNIVGGANTCGYITGIDVVSPPSVSCFYAP
jgi:hypothetical protein